MKRIVLTLAAMGVALGAVAQNYEVPLKNGVITNGFWSNWFVSGGVNFNSAYTSQENLGNKNPFSTDRGTFGFDVAIGKWFAPSIGLRTKFEGVWSKRVMNTHMHHTYHYWQLHEDVLFNISNMLCGYNEERVWNFIPYVGLGVAKNMSSNRTEFAYNVGLLNNFRINKHVTAFVDIHANAMDGRFDGAPMDGWASHNRGASRHFDKMLGVSVGLTYNIGKSKWDKAPDVDALLMMHQEQLAAMNSSLDDQQNENERLRNMLEEQKAAQQPEMQQERTVQVVANSQSVFFPIGSAKVANRKDLVDLKDMVAVAKENNRKIVVTGYADSKTGSAEYNQKLSDNRAQTVAEELIKMGCPRELLVIEGKGGVDSLSPFSYNRRAVVKLQ